MPFKSAQRRSEYRRERDKRQYHADPVARMKQLARAKANRAVKRGEIKPDVCADCGSRDAKKHHEDYADPLAVRWLCDRCHLKRHNGSFKPRKVTA